MLIFILYTAFTALFWILADLCRGDKSLISRGLTKLGWVVWIAAFPLVWSSLRLTRLFLNRKP